MKKILNIFLILLLFSGCDSTGIEQSSAEIHVESSESEHSESFINLENGLEIIQEYEDAVIILRTSDRMYGVMSKNGDMLVDFAPYYMTDYNDGLVIARTGGTHSGTYREYKYGVYGNHPPNEWTDGWLIKPRYDHIRFGDEAIEVELNKMRGAFRYNGEFIIDREKYKQFQLRDDGYVKVSYEDGKSDGTKTIECWDGTTTEAPTSPTSKWGIITMDGEVLVEPIYESIEESSDGYSVVMLDGLYGYCDEEWNLAIPLQYSYVQPFSEGRAVVSRESVLQIIDKDGNATSYQQYHGPGGGAGEARWCDEVILNTITGEIRYLCQGYNFMAFGENADILVADDYSSLCIYDAHTSEAIVPKFTLGGDNTVINGMTSDHENNCYLIAATQNIPSKDNVIRAVYVYVLDSQGYITEIIETAAESAPYKHTRLHIPITIDGNGNVTVEGSASKDTVRYI